MCISTDEISTHCDEDHGVRDVDALFVVSHEASPSGHQPKVRSTTQQTVQNLEAFLVIGSDYFDDEIDLGGLLHKFELIVVTLVSALTDWPSIIPAGGLASRPARS